MTKTRKVKRDRILAERAYARAEYWAKNPGVAYGQLPNVAKTAASAGQVTPQSKRGV